MKDEIKEILDKFDKVLKNYELDKKFGQMSVDSICHLFPSEMVAIKDYITNLQEKLKVSQTNEETYRLEMQDITKILGLDEHTTFDEVKEYATNLQERCEYLERSNNRREDEIMSLRDECVDGETYKSRCEKAIEYIKKSMNNPQPFYEYLFGDENGKVENLDKLLNILQGEDKEIEQLKEKMKTLYKYTPEKGFRLVGDKDV